MIKHKIGVTVCCAALLLLAGCSRQQSDWQKTRETNTADAYEQFLKKYPSGEFSPQARARAKELYEERDWQKARDADTPEAYQAFLKQYPDGKWTEEARIRVENFTLAQAPSGSGTAVPGDTSAPAADVGAAPAGAGTASAKQDQPQPRAAAAAPPQAMRQPAAASAPQPVAAAAGSLPKAGKGDSFGVQLGAFKSGPDAAHARWARLQKAYPRYFSGLSSKVLPKKTPAGTLYRLQAMGLTEKHARDICRALKAKSQACVVVPPNKAQG